jgi:exodeoxyribonuclease VIII
MKKSNNHIMLDLETMGNDSQAAIFAIGAVRFNTTSGITDSFYMLVDLASSMQAGMTANADTIKWWMQQSDDARKAIYTTAHNLEVALQRFTDFAGADRDKPIVWGCGADFDNVILASAYRLLKRPNPWEFYNNRCYRTLKGMYPQVKAVRKGTYHNAFDDAANQAEHLLAIVDYANIEI